MVMTVPAAVVILLRRSRIHIPGLSVLTAGTLFFSYTVLTASWSPSLNVLKRELLFLAGGLWSLLCASLVIAPERERVYRFLLISGGFAVAVTIHGWYWINLYGSLVTSMELRELDFRAFYQLAGRMSAIGAALFLSMALYEGFLSRRQLIALLLGLFCGIFTFLSGSRLSALGIVGALTIAFLAGARDRRQGQWVADVNRLTLLGIILGIVLIVSQLDLREMETIRRLRSLFLEAEAAPGVIDRYGRLNYVQIAFALWMSSPILGVGLMGFGPLGFQTESAVNPGLYPHNLVAQILTETGLLGMIVFLGFLWSAYRGISLARLSRDPLLVVLLATSVVPWSIALFSQTISMQWKLYTFIGLMTLPAPGSVRAERRSDESPDTGDRRLSLSIRVLR